MDAALVVHNPLVTGVTVFAALILAFALFRSWLRARWERAGNPNYRIEPDIDRPPITAAYADAAEGIGSGPRPGPMPRRRTGKRLLAFAVGIVLGVFVVPAAVRNGTDPWMHAVSALQARLAEAIGAIDPTLVGAIGPGTSDSFVLAMQQDLPRRVDDRTMLVSVAGGQGVVTLGHLVSEPISDDQTRSFAEAARDRIVSGTCAAAATSEIRTLNDDGVEFRFVYADPVGRTIAAITLEPDFCERTR